MAESSEHGDSACPATPEGVAPSSADLPGATPASSASVSKALSGCKKHGRAVRDAVTVRRGGGALGGKAAMQKKRHGTASEARKEAPADPKVETIRTVVSDMLSDPSTHSDPATVQSVTEILVLSMSENKAHAGVQTYCLATLYELAFESKANRPAIVAAGVFARIVECMADLPSAVAIQKRGCALLWLLALEKEHLLNFVRAGACSSVVWALRSQLTDDAVANAALGSIKPLSLVDYGRKALVAAGANEAVASAMLRNASTASLQAYGCSILSNLAVDVNNNRVAMASANELDAILGAMMEHNADSAVLREAIFALHNLATSERNLRSVAEHGLPVEDLLENARVADEGCRADIDILLKRIKEMRSFIAKEATRRSREEAASAAVVESQPVPTPLPLPAPAQETIQTREPSSTRKPLPTPPPAQETNQTQTADPVLAEEVQRSAMSSGERGEFESALTQLHVALRMKRTIYGEGAANDDLVHVMNCMGYLSVLIGDLLTAVAWYKESLLMQRRIPGVDPVSLAKTMTDVATLCVKTGEFNNAESYLIDALKIKRRADGSIPADSIGLLEDLADVYRAKGDADRAEKLYIHATKCYKAQPGSDHAIAGVVTKLAGLAGVIGHLDKAQRRFEMALELHRKASADAPGKEVIDALNNLGYARAVNGNDLDAIEAYEESVVLQTELLEAGGEEALANTFSTLGVLHLKTGDAAVARDSLESALFIKKGMNGDVEPASSQDAGFYSFLLTNLGEACVLGEDLLAAEQYYGEALSYVGSNPKKAAFLLATLGDLASERSDYEAAKDSFTHAIEAAEVANNTKTGIPAFDLSEMLTRLGNVCSILRDYAAAIEKYDLSLKIRQKAGRMQTKEAAGTLHSLGVAHGKRGSPSAARANLDRALEIKRRLYKDDEGMDGTMTAEECISISETYKAIGDVEAERREYKSAELQYEKAVTVLERTSDELTPALIAAAASIKTELGNVAGNRGDIHLAQDNYCDALELIKELCPSPSTPTPELIEALNKLRNAYAVNGENTRALELYEEIVDAQRLLAGDTDVAMEKMNE